MPKKRKYTKKRGLPKNPKKGTKVTRLYAHGSVTFQATGKKGFGKWRIIEHKPC